MAIYYRDVFKFFRGGKSKSGPRGFHYSSSSFMPQHLRIEWPRAVELSCANGVRKGCYRLWTGMRGISEVLAGAGLKCVQPRTLTHMDEHTFTESGQGRGLPEWVGSGRVAAAVAVIGWAGPVKRGSGRARRFQFC